MLLGRQRDAEHFGLERLGEVEPEPAPARADVEHASGRASSAAWRRCGASWRPAPLPASCRAARNRRRNTACRRRGRACRARRTGRSGAARCAWSGLRCSPDAGGGKRARTPSIAFDHMASMPPGPMFWKTTRSEIERVALDDVEFAVHEGFGSGEHRIERDRPRGAPGLDVACAPARPCRHRTCASFHRGPVMLEVSGADQARNDALQHSVHGKPHSNRNGWILCPICRVFEKFPLASKSCLRHRSNCASLLPAAIGRLPANKKARAVARAFCRFRLYVGGQASSPAASSEFGSKKASGRAFSLMSSP